MKYICRQLNSHVVLQTMQESQLGRAPCQPTQPSPAGHWELRHHASPLPPSPRRKTHILGGQSCHCNQNPLFLHGHKWHSPSAPSPHTFPDEGSTIRHAAVPRGGAGRTIQLPPHINIFDTRLKTQLVHIHLLLEKCQEGTNIPSLFLGLYQKYLSAFWPFIPFVTSMLSASQGGEVL